MSRLQILKTKREDLKWVDAKPEDYGGSLDLIKAKFQSMGLLNKGSNPVIRDSIQVGKKMKYICSKGDCSFAIRITIYTDDPINIQLETASNLSF